MFTKNRKRLSCIFFALSTALSGNSGIAGIMLDSVPEANYVAYANETQFNAIGQFVGGASGTLIAPDWVLTAGHVNVVVDNINTANSTKFQIRGMGTQYTAVESIIHPTYLANGSNLGFGFDLQLVRLSSSVAGVTPASIYRGSSEGGSLASITGFGIGGTGTAGPNLPSAQRAGTNVLDAVVSFSNGPQGQVGAQNAMLIADFDSGAANFNTLAFAGSSQAVTSLEYHLADLDSGGGVFIQENGQWFLAGVNSGIQSQRSFLDLNDSDPLLNGSRYGYGAISYITRVSSYTGFIDNITAVPEPASLSLVGIALAFGILGRSRMRNATANRAVK
jgi:hypothetical protein